MTNLNHPQISKPHCSKLNSQSLNVKTGTTLTICNFSTKPLHLGTPSTSPEPLLPHLAHPPKISSKFKVEFLRPFRRTPRRRRRRLFTAFFGFAFIHNFLSGPTCIVRLQTAVQTHRFAPLERIRDFSSGMEIIVPLIQNAQG